MLDRSQLEIAIGASLAGAVLVGWLLHALWRRLSRAPSSDPARLRVLAGRLHDAEASLERTEAALREAEEARDAAIAAETRALEEQEARMSAAAQAVQAELEAELRELRIDRETAMDGLRNARARIAELEAKLQASGQG